MLFNKWIFSIDTLMEEIKFVATESEKKDVSVIKSYIGTLRLTGSGWEAQDQHFSDGLVCRKLEAFNWRPDGRNQANSFGEIYILRINLC